MFTLSCPAKINLFLAIHGKDPSGYHLLETVIARLKEPFDEITINPAQTLQIDCPSLPQNEQNTVEKAIRILESHSGKSLNYKIQITKHIPPGSGLGGASSDAAAVMLFLNKHAALKIPHQTLMQLGAKVGMDVPFFISGHPVALCTHFGEKVSPLPSLPENLEIEIRAQGSQNTKTAYALWDQHFERSEEGRTGPSIREAKANEVSNHKNHTAAKTPAKTSNELQKALKAKNTKAIIQNLQNDFQTIFPLEEPSTSYERRLLAGSGAAFAVFREKDTHK